MSCMAAEWSAGRSGAFAAFPQLVSAAGFAALLAVSAVAVRSELPPQDACAPPALLRDTGLYADFTTLEIDPKSSLSPRSTRSGARRGRSDGGSRCRAGTAVDASDPDAWVFPVGTRRKEFAFGGRPIETRMLERLPGGAWRYAAYAWSADGREAALAPATGQRGAFAFGGGRSHTIPAVSDCKVCHELRRTPVLGFGLLQLSPDRYHWSAARRTAAGAGRRSRLPRRGGAPGGTSGTVPRVPPPRIAAPYAGGAARRSAT